MIKTLKIALYNPNNDKYLMIKHDNNPNQLHPNQWDIIGGIAKFSDKKDDYTLQREIKKELSGATVSSINLLDKFEYTFFKNNKPITSHVYCYLGIINNKIDKLKTKNKNQELKYYSLDEMIDIDSVPAIKKYITSHKQIIEEKSIKLSKLHI